MTLNRFSSAPTGAALGQPENAPHVTPVAEESKEIMNTNTTAKGCLPKSMSNSTTKTESERKVEQLIEQIESDEVSLHAETNLPEKQAANREWFYRAEIAKAKAALKLAGKQGE